MDYSDPAVTALFVALFYGCVAGFVVGGTHRVLLLFTEGR